MDSLEGWRFTCPHCHDSVWFELQYSPAHEAYYLDVAHGGFQMFEHFLYPDIESVEHITETMLRRLSNTLTDRDSNGCAKEWFWIVYGYSEAVS